MGSSRSIATDERGGCYAIGLDGDKRHSDPPNRQHGHLLWSGIVLDDQAQAIADWLMSDELYSRRGVGAMSILDAGYNPLGHHHGTAMAQCPEARSRLPAVGKPAPLVAQI
jgi:glycogen debranching enzyme